MERFFDVTIECMCVLKGEGKIIQYPISLNAEDEKQAESIVEEQYGLTEDWNMQLILRHLEEFGLKEEDEENYIETIDIVGVKEID